MSNVYYSPGLDGMTSDYEKDDRERASAQVVDLLAAVQKRVEA